MDFTAAAWFDEDDRKRAEAEAMDPPEKLPLHKRITRSVLG